MEIINYIMMYQDKIKSKNIDGIFSYSKIQTFDSCPQKYKINYIDKVRKTHESIEAFMGKRVHEVLDWLFKNYEEIGHYITLDILLNKYKELWEEKWHENIYSANIPVMYKIKFKSKDDLYHLGIKCLVNYYNRYQPNFTQNIFKTEMKCEVTINGVKFRGYIDRVDKYKNGLYEIFDYKTGKQPKSKSNITRNLQLIIYQLAIQERYNDCKDVILNWYYLQSNEIVSVKYTSQKINELKNNIFKRILDIKGEKKFLAKESLLCEWCYFWEECEIKSTSNPARKLS